MTRTIELKGDVYAELFGNYDGNAREIERAFGVRMLVANGGLQLIGDDEKTEAAEKLIKNVLAVLGTGQKRGDLAGRRRRQSYHRAGQAYPLYVVGTKSLLRSYRQAHADVRHRTRGQR